MTPAISVIFVVFRGLRSEALVFQWVECKFVIFAVFAKTAPFGRGQKHSLPKNMVCATPRNEAHKRFFWGPIVGVFGWGTHISLLNKNKCLSVRWVWGKRRATRSARFLSCESPLSREGSQSSFERLFYPPMVLAKADLEPRCNEQA